jgi:hypothetical protein
VATPKTGTATVDVWQTREDVDDTVHRIYEEMQKGTDLPRSMVGDIQDTIARSDPALVRYFFAELSKYSQGAVGYFEERI